MTSVAAAAMMSGGSVLIARWPPARGRSRGSYNPAPGPGTHTSQMERAEHGAHQPATEDTHPLPGTGTSDFSVRNICEQS